MLPTPSRMLHGGTIIVILYLQIVSTVHCQGDKQKVIAVKESSQQPACDIKLFTITGSIQSLQHDDLTTLRMSLMNTKILINYGQHVGYPKEDGTFQVDNLPPDSYVVEVTHPRYIYEPIRVDITSKGKMRARRVNHIQPQLVQTLDYPLKFKPRSLHNYFMPRETWRVMDMLLNPMVIMMVVPMGLIWLLPKMMPSTHDMQAQSEAMQMPDYKVPELSEMMASMFGQQKQKGSAADGGAGTSAPGQAALTSSQAGGGSGAANRKNKRR